MKSCCIPVFDIDEGGLGEVNIDDCLPENEKEVWSQIEETLTYEAGVGTS